jgi:hypothetical protein
MTALFSRPTSRGEVLSCGPQNGPQILVLQPLFDEANRCRRTISLMMRALASRGIGTTLPDLPGLGESLVPLAETRWEDWSAAVSAWAEEIRPVAIAAFRGGALLDSVPGLTAHWRFAPETGARIVRDLERTRLTSTAADKDVLGGHKLAPAFISTLRTADLAPHDRVRTVRPDSDAADADLHVPGTPLWRRAEPGEDAALAESLADDLAQWIHQCAAS